MPTNGTVATSTNCQVVISRNSSHIDKRFSIQPINLRCQRFGFGGSAQHRILPLLWSHQDQQVSQEGDADQRAKTERRAGGREAPAAGRAEELEGLCRVDWDWGAGLGECGGIAVSVFDQAMRKRGNITKSVIDTCLTSRTHERNCLTPGRCGSAAG
jgi:hypothetical protein